MSTSNDIFDTDIKEAIAEERVEYIYGKIEDFRKEFFDALEDFFKYVGEIINHGALERSPFSEEKWLPLTFKTRKEKRRFFHDGEDEDNLRSHFYSRKGTLERALRSGVFQASRFPGYFLTTLHIVHDGKENFTNINLYNEKRLKARIKNLIKDAKDVSFYFKFAGSLRSVDWKELLSGLSDENAYAKFFETGKMSLPNEVTRPLLRPALNRYLRKEVKRKLNKNVMGV
jgi:hypothetical protein